MQRNQQLIRKIFGLTGIATLGAAQIPEGDGYLAALINLRFMANAVWTTDEAVDRLSNRVAPTD